MNIKYTILLIVFFFNTIHTKVLIITHNFDRPHFVELHYKTFKKFLHDEYQYVVFSDAKTEDMHEQIASVCHKFDIPCIRIPQLLHETGIEKDHPSFRHARGIQYSLEQLGFDHNDILVIIDTDLLLIRPFSFVKYMENVDIGAIFRQMNGLNFLWPGLSCFNMAHFQDKKMINFFPGYYKGLYMDTGWNTYFYLNSHPHLRIRSMDMLAGSQLFCPYTDHIKTPRMVKVPGSQKKLSQKQQMKILQKLGFNKHEINFLKKKPHNPDFFFHHYFLHYRYYANIELLDEFINIITA